MLKENHVLYGAKLVAYEVARVDQYGVPTLRGCFANDHGAIIATTIPGSCVAYCMRNYEDGSVVDVYYHIARHDCKLIDKIVLAGRAD